MKTIGVISDTHLSASSGMFQAVKRAIRNTKTLEDLQKLVEQHFRDVDLIIHAGDLVELPVFEMLRRYAPVEAVQGNMDTAEVCRTFPHKKE